MACVVVGEAEWYVCGIEFLDAWLCNGYRLFGTATTERDLKRLAILARREVEAM